MLPDRENDRHFETAKPGKGNTTFGGDSKDLPAEISYAFCGQIKQYDRPDGYQSSRRDRRSRNVAISGEHLKLTQPDRRAETKQNTLLQRLVDKDASYIPHALSVPQFTTLYAVLRRLISRLHEAIAAPSHLAVGLDANLAADGSASRAPESQTCPLGLDELDELARTRTGYAFAELTPELQDAVLDLIAAGDLTTGKLDLALWLEDLRSHTAPESARKPAA